MLDLAIPLGEKPGNSATFGFDFHRVAQPGSPRSVPGRRRQAFVVGLWGARVGRLFVDVLELLMDRKTLWRWP